MRATRPRSSSSVACSRTMAATFSCEPRRRSGDVEGGSGPRGESRPPAPAALPGTLPGTLLVPGRPATSAAPEVPAGGK